jgi:hypothetical protein
MRQERELMVKSNQARALWPYLVVLTILFVLSLAAPRSWDRTKPSTESTTAPLVQHQPATPTPTVLQAQQAVPSVKPSAPLAPPVTEKVTQQYQQEPAAASPPLVPADTSLNPPLTTGPSPEFSQQLAHVEQQWLAAREQMRLNWESARVEFNNVTVPISRVLRPDVLAKYIATRTRADRAHAVAQAELPPQPSNGNQSGNIGLNLTPPVPAAPTPVELSENWPLASELIARCGILRQDASTQMWANQTTALLETLSTKQLHDPASRELLLGLRHLANHATSMLARLGNVTDDALPLRRVQFDLLRRLELWEAAATRSAEVGPWASCIVPSAERDTRVLKPTQTLLNYLATDPAGVNWKSYLQVDQIHDLSRLTELPAPPTTKRASHGFPHGDVTQPVAKLINDRRQFAERVITRTQRPELTKEQQVFLRRPELQGYLNGLRNWAVQPRLLADMLQTIENYEETRLPSDAGDLGQAIADLQRSLDPRDVALGKLLDQHYRNANARLTVTREMFNRMIPKQVPTSERVNEVISGALARGQRTTTNDVHVKLVPHNDGWNLVYDIAGHVDSNTTSTSGPVTFVNQGASQFTAEKSVFVTGAGIRSKPATAFAQNRTHLVCMQTECDDMPLISGVVRNIAQKKHEEALPGAQQEISHRVANKAAATIDREVEARLATLENRVRQNIVKPLEQWGLDPTIVSMQTTEERATARFRLASSEQLAAHTSRPLALSDSLASVQVHESAFNSFLAGLELSQRTWTLPELVSHVQRKIGREKPIDFADLPENVTVRFADNDPVVMQCLDGQIRIIISLAELKQAERSWENVVFRVNYRLVAEGLQLKLIRESSVSLGGDHTGRVDVVLRTIGSKCFPRDQDILLLPESFLKDERLRGLVWSQVQVENGWIGLSLNDEATVVARQKAPAATR